VVAGYLVNPDYQNHPDQMKHAVVNPAVYNTLADFMEGKPKVQFKEPENRKIAVGDQRSIPGVECDSVGDARDRLEDAGFSVYIGSPIASNCPAGTVAETSPSGRTLKGGVVMISPSSGQANQPAQPGQPSQPAGPPGRR
jgi:hypothetical protein